MARFNTLNSDYIAQAKVLLEEARADNPKEGWLGRVLLLLCRAKAMPQRIGTTYEELRMFANACDIERAKEWLKRARSESGLFRHHRGPEVYYVRRYLVRAGLRAEDIGTSTKELEELASQVNP